MQILRVHEQKHRCEALYAEGRIIDAAVSLLEIANTVSDDVKTNKLIMDWLAGELLCCASRKESTSTIRIYEAMHIYAGNNWR